MREAFSGLSGHLCHQLPPTLDSQTTYAYEKAPDMNGSFFDQRAAPVDHTDLSLNTSYANYMRMNKVLVGNRGAMQLEQIYDDLKDETAPHYLTVAGWALAESALVRSDKSTATKSAMLEEAVATWRRAYLSQKQAEQRPYREGIDYGTMYRIALDMAVSPLLAGIINKDVSKAVCERSFANCLGIARSNMAALAIAKAAGSVEVVGMHAGVGYECNALLGFNRRLSRTWFAIPAMARCDSGYFHRDQTHDLVVIHQKYGEIQSATPVEIKSKASLRDRRRYSALLVRGKMHLSVEGKGKPEYTLASIGAVHDGLASADDEAIANNATDRFVSMVRDYYAGEALGNLASKHTVTVFRDNTQVIARHPGLSKDPYPQPVRVVQEAAGRVS